jgi:hypothetical protein
VARDIDSFMDVGMYHSMVSYREVSGPTEKILVVLADYPHINPPLHEPQHARYAKLLLIHPQVIKMYVHARKQMLQTPTNVYP